MSPKFDLSGLVLGEPESFLSALGGKSIDKSIIIMGGGNDSEEKS